MCEKSDSKLLLAVDIIYKLSAPCTLTFIVLSYFYSVKPVFDKHEELQSKSTQVEKLESKVSGLETEIETKTSNLNLVRSKLTLTSKELESKNINLASLSKKYKQTETSLATSNENLLQTETKISNLSQQVLKKDSKLILLSEEINDKTDALKKLNDSLDNSTDAAINFYIQRVVTDVYRDASNRSIYSSYNKDEPKPNLKAELLKLVSSNTEESYDINSEKHYEQLALKEINEFAQTKLAENESDFSKVFDLLTFVSNKKYYKKIKNIYESSGLDLPEKYKQ